jgi:hypothetical protein
MVGVDITHDEHHQQTTGRSLLGFGLERREPGPQEDEIEARVRSAKGMEAVAAHLRGKAERAVMNAAEASGSATLSETAEAVISMAGSLRGSKTTGPIRDRIGPTRA